MPILSTIIILLVVILGCTIWLRLARRKRAMRIMMAQSQQLSDAAVTALVKRLNWSVKLPLGSEPVADVWGHGIMAFEYELPDPEFVVTAERLNHELRDIAVASQVEVPNPTVPPFMVTDLWQRDGGTHFDVAYMVNEATIKYAQDVARV